MSTELMSLLSLIVAVASAVFAGFAWHAARSTLQAQTILAMLTEYRSAQMMISVRVLWDFYRENGDAGLVDAYNETYKNDLGTLREFERAEQVAKVLNTLDYHRRTVSHFYNQLATACAIKAIQIEVVFAAWGPEDLEIIPRILLPLEGALTTRFGYQHGPSKAPLQALYDECSAYWGRTRPAIAKPVQTSARV